jgi:septal ring factor EnvC (AmiA/AmiB activator)
MKIDSKFIIIIVLTVLSGFFLLKWLNASDGELARENKKLLSEIKVIEKQRDSLSTLRTKLEDEYKILEKEIKERDSRIAKLNQDLAKSEEELKKAKSDLADQQARLDEINREIERIKKLPPKREGEDLLNSLKKKLTDK